MTKNKIRTRIFQQWGGGTSSCHSGRRARKYRSSNWKQCATCHLNFTIINANYLLAETAATQHLYSVNQTELTIEAQPTRCGHAR